jgi:hypothetical protein
MLFKPIAFLLLDVTAHERSDMNLMARLGQVPNDVEGADFSPSLGWKRVAMTDEE